MQWAQRKEGMDVHVQLLRQAQLPAWVFPEGHNPMAPPVKEEEVPAAGLEALKGVDEEKLAQLLAEALQRQAAEGGAVKKEEEEGAVGIKEEVKEEVKQEEVKEERADGGAAAARDGEEAYTSAAAAAADTAGKRPAEKAGLDRQGEPEQIQKKRVKAMEAASPQTSGMDDAMPEVRLQAFLQATACLFSLPVPRIHRRLSALCLSRPSFP